MLRRAKPTDCDVEMDTDAEDATDPLPRRSAKGAGHPLMSATISNLR
jgi:hypothetical protein